MDVTALLSPTEVRARLPLSPQATRAIAEARRLGQRIVQGRDERTVLVVGPCSIHDQVSTLEYARRLKELSQRVQQNCFLVMRVYIEKSRSSTGWKGFLYDPHLDASHDIQTGILWTRELLLRLAEMGVPCATEFVDPLAALYFEDLVSWGFIGARTSSSQIHRQFASQLQIPIGFKNSVDGNLENAVQGVRAAEVPHTSLAINPEGRVCALHSQGNPFSHVVLRGSQEETNYDCASVQRALELLRQYHLPERIMIDCSHGNSRKCFAQQEAVLLSVLEQRERGNRAIFGMMLESHLESGSQFLSEDPSLLKYAVSITDPCIDWDTTEKLICCVDAALGCPA